MIMWIEVTWMKTGLVTVMSLDEYRAASEAGKTYGTLVRQVSRADVVRFRSGAGRTWGRA